MTIKVYVSPSCQPCQEVIQRVKGRKDVEIVNVETEKGFLDFQTEVLSKRDSGVPSAFKDGQECEILADEDSIFFNCPGDPASSESE